MSIRIKSKENNKLLRIKAKSGEEFVDSFNAFLEKHPEIEYSSKEGARTTLSKMFNRSQNLGSSDSYRVEFEALLKKFQLRFKKESSGNELFLDKDTPTTPEPEKVECWQRRGPRMADSACDHSG